MDQINPLQIDNKFFGIRLNDHVKKLQNSSNRIANESQEKIKELTEEFESFLLYYALKSMRETVPKSGLFHSNAEDIFTSLLDQEITKNSVGKGRGLGLARIMQQQLTNRENQTLEDRGLAAKKQVFIHHQDTKTQGK